MVAFSWWSKTLEKKEENYIFLILVVTQKPGVTPFFVTQKHWATPFLITQTCGATPFFGTQNAKVINFCDDYIIWNSIIRINRSYYEAWVIRNEVTPHFWVQRNEATPWFWVTRNGAAPDFWVTRNGATSGFSVTTITRIFQFLPFLSLFLKQYEKNNYYVILTQQMTLWNICKNNFNDRIPLDYYFQPQY